MTINEIIKLLQKIEAKNYGNNITYIEILEDGSIVLGDNTKTKAEDFVVIPSHTR